MTLESWMNNGRGELPNSRKKIPLREERSMELTVDNFPSEGKRNNGYID